MASNYQKKQISNDHNTILKLMPKWGITPKEILASLSAGVVIGILGLFMQASYAALIFAGELRQFLPQGIGILLLGALIMGLIMTVSSSFAGSIAMPQDSTAAIMGVVAAAIVASMSMASPTATFATVVAAMIFSSVLAGMLLWLLGQFNLGHLVRYMPYPVVGGFLTGTGWLLVSGGISVMADATLGVELLTTPALVRWLPGFLFAFVLLLLMRRYTQSFILPLTLVASIALFYLGYFLLNGEIESAQANKWLLGPFPEGGLFQPVTLVAFSMGNWMVVLGNMVNLGTIFIVGTISFLLNATGLELAARTNIDLNRELKAVGISNIAAGLAGSSVGYHILSFSTLGYRMGATSRLVGFVTAAVIASALFFGAGLVASFPKMIAGGLLIYLGLDFLTEWLYDARRKLSMQDYLLIWLILATIILFGMLQGVIVGILVSALLFVFSYTTTSTVRHTLSRENFQSYVMRPPLYEELLQKEGKSLAIFELQGFIFFGSAHTLVEQLKNRIEEVGPSGLQFLLLDFRLVTGIDSSASLSFSRLKQVADQANIVLILTNLAAPLKKQLHDSMINVGTETRTLHFHDLDQGVAWVEELIIANIEDSLAQKEGQLPLQPQTFLQHFGETLMIPVDEAETRLRLFMEVLAVERGTVLLQEGQPVESVYFIEEGQIVIYTKLADGRVKQLRIQEAGTAFGEIGIYSGQMATATVAAKEAAVLYTLSAKNFARMEKQDPDLAIATHRLIANILGRKLTQANYAIVALQK